MTKFRIGIVGIAHESNTFIPEPTSLAHFERANILEGEELRGQFAGGHHEISGFLHVLEESGCEAVPLLYAHAGPWGTVSDEALDTFWARVVELLREAGELHGILAAPHGAAVNESRHDMDGWWMGALRREVGPDLPVVATMDPHANLTPAMVESVQVLIPFRENPHLDRRSRGEEAAHLLIRTLRGEIAPVAAGAYPPIAMNIERHFTGEEPMLLVHRELEKTRGRPGILSAGVTMGFPYADVPEMGSGFVVVANADPGLAREEADRLAGWLQSHRDLFVGHLISPQEALDRIPDSPRPVGLLDMGDNSGGGAPGDSTFLLHHCLENPPGRVLAILHDPESVEAAQAAGVGKRVHLKIGGKKPRTPARSIEREMEVVRFHHGAYMEKEVRHSGRARGDMGPSVLVQSEDGLLTILLTTKRASAGTLQPLFAMEIHPRDFDVVIIKGVHAPLGAYAEVCPTLIRVNTPGVTTADLNALSYNNRRKPLFPFEQ